MAQETRSRSSSSDLSPPPSDLGEGPSTTAPASASARSNTASKGQENQVGEGSTSAAVKPKLVGVAADDEKYVRYARYQARYHRFLEEAEFRRQKRMDLVSRNKTWEESLEDTQDRIQAIDNEKALLLEKIETMKVAKQRYNDANAEAILESEDLETKRKWEAYFSLESDELDL